MQTHYVDIICLINSISQHILILIPAHYQIYHLIHLEALLQIFALQKNFQIIYLKFEKGFNTGMILKDLKCTKQSPGRAFGFPCNVLGLLAFKFLNTTIRMKPNHNNTFKKPSGILQCFIFQILELYFTHERFLLVNLISSF